MNRKDWIDTLCKITLPVLERGASGRLSREMPTINSQCEDQYLEAIGRVVCGIAPWIELKGGDDYEKERRELCRELIIKTLDNITTRDSADYISFDNSPQSLVDAAYLVQGLLRAPSLWSEVTPRTKQNIINGLKLTRKFTPCDNNWLLFASIVEAFLLSIGEECNMKRLLKGVKSFDLEFYMGDGMFGDGATFCMDYYNSYVIHPMLIDILSVMKSSNIKGAVRYYDREVLRYKRYVEIQERTVSPEGTYPIYGRTQICRLGAFQALSQSVLLGLVPTTLSVAQVRGAMDKLLERFVSERRNFEDNGFLSIGINGAQPSIAEGYVSMGSGYHCCNFFVCLGLSPKSEFWQSKGEAWSSLKAFSGEDIGADHALYDLTMRDNIVRALRIIRRLVCRRFGL